MKLPRISRHNLSFYRNLLFRCPVFATGAAAGCIVLLLGFGTSASGQVTLTGSDTSPGMTSWNTGTRWSDGLAPSAGKDYANNVSGRLLRTPDKGPSTQFAGDSLTIDSGAALLLKTNNKNTVTIDDLRLNNGGSVRIVDASRILTLAGNITVQSGGGELYSSQPEATNLIVDADVTGSGPLSKTQPGTATFNGDFSGYTGILSVDGGTARLNSSFGGSVVVNSTKIAGESPIAGDLTLDAGTVVVDATTPASLHTSGNLTLTGVSAISLVDGLPSSSAPFTVLSYDGTLTGTTANLTVGGAENYRNPVLSTAVPKIITLSVGSENRTWTGENGTLWDINSSQNWQEGDKLFYQLDAVTFNDTGAGDVAVTGVLLPASITIDSSSDYNFTAEAGSYIAGTTTLIKSGTGTATIGGSNTFSGGITIAGGTLRGGSFSQSFGANGQIITVESGATLDFNSANSASRDFNAIVSGAGVGNAGAVVNNGPTGPTNGLGALTLTGDASIGGTSQWDVRPIVAGTGLLDLAGHTLTKVGANNINIADSTISADGSIRIDEGSITISRSVVNGAGSVNVNAGGMLRLMNYTSGSFSKSIDVASGGTLSQGGADFTLDSPVTVTGDTLLESTSNTLTVANPITGTGNIEKTGAGTVVLPATLAHSGSTAISAGALYLNSNTSTAIDLTAHPISGQGLLSFGRTGGSVDTVYSLTGNSNFEGNIRVLTGNLRISSAGSLGNAPAPKTITMINRGAGFQLDGSGGDVNIPAGFDFIISNDVPESPAIGNIAGNNTINGTIAINIGGGGGTVSVFGGSLTLAGDISNASTPRSIILGGANGSGKITGTISNGSNALGVDKVGPNTWTLTADNVHTGATTISSGTLQIGDGGPSGSLGSGNVVNNGSLVIDRSDDYYITNLISGSGSFTQSGAGTSYFGADNTYTGDTLMTAGTLSLDHPSIADGSAVRISGTGTLDLYHGETDTVASFYIDGEPQTLGLWGRVGSIAAFGADFETPRITSDGLLNVTTSGSVATPFEQWATDQKLPVNNDGPGDNPDSDGLTNIQEFAFDSDPLSGASDGKSVSKIAPVGGVPSLTLTIPVRAAVGVFSGAHAISASGDGITYRIEGSAGLDSWLLDIEEVTGGDAAAIQMGLPELNPGWTYRTFRSTGPATAADAQFLRAGVSE